ncbi:1-phosphofructokinase family hexose kinase [Patulibacter sp.]|uniref:1-phosphofructokinase family hexose kinase n=1 Tax=Patulibacter sp. TaxID=1912859 RepID=UPI0027198451|nr:1-phosphofructokinase family hexose kinase [Patulibacter sp.]MDO9408125.1 1-phosphofructokinase family hexose kinase [Patulibacter sp.]
MIVTVTPNPSLDVALHVDELRRGEVLRATAERHDAGGKGLNVSRALAGGGVPTRAVLPLGGSAGADLLALLRGDHGVEPVHVPLTGATRSNIGIVEPDGTLTKVNAAGPVLSSDEVDALRVAILAAAASASWVVLAGSLPKGLSPDFYAGLIGPLQALGARVALDSSGAAFDLGLAAGPDLVKPNVHELAEVLGRDLRTVGDLADAAAELRRRGPRTVLASAGPDGAVLVDDGGSIHGEPPPIVPASSVGAGDAMLAGYLAATEAAVPGAPSDPAAALTAALAWGAGAASLPGSRMPRSSDLHPEGVRIHPALDRDRPLEEVAVAPTSTADAVAATTGAHASSHPAKQSTPITEGPRR